MSDIHGKIWWNELMTRDVAKARAYYEQTCGWTFSTMPMDVGDYHLASLNGEIIAGLMDMADMGGMDGVPPHWFTYLAVDDVDAATAATEAAGGSVTRAPFDVPGVGRIAILMDPSGAGIGLMTPAPQE